MGYVKRVLRSDEVIVYRGKLHWTIYIYALLFALVGIGFLFLARAFPRFETAMIVSAVTAFILAFLAAAKAWFDQWITEICVTSHRVIYKRGFIWRHTSEMRASGRRLAIRFTMSAAFTRALSVRNGRDA